MEFQINKTEVYGLEKSVIASGNAMRVEMDDNMLDLSLEENTVKYQKDLKRAYKLGNTDQGEGHDNFLNGIIVQFDMYAPLYMWKQIQRYHWMDFISSQSTMHRLTRFNIKESCVGDVDSYILERYQQLLDEYNDFDNRYKDEINKVQLKNKLWRKLVASLPSGFVLGATMTTNYRQLKTIYHQRKHHKLEEWHAFCEWVKSLPQFKELCLKDYE